MVLGVWHPSVVLTYVGLAAATGGLAAASTGHPKLALAALVVAGVADLFDGTVARRFDRTAREQAFGAQIDSLVDGVSFLALPVAILGLVAGWWSLLVGIPYVIAGVARLAHFTTEQATQGPVRHYRGVPVTYAALVLPVVALLATAVPGLRPAALCLVTLALAVGFVLDVPIPKPGLKASAGFGLVAIAALVALAVVPW